MTWMHASKRSSRVVSEMAVADKPERIEQGEVAPVVYADIDGPSRKRDLKFTVKITLFEFY